ncbi:MAG: CopD family protein [Bacteroidetes bacterium]|nr:MAG: CopD family protein [Bacteroidota bacterium]REJ99943.1 MAG: CopD family protein [Bacteroidota bacterium]REK35877.1 MAG: CopD family protein [Bacteroidota bacterium]REK50646.1 MAG: CopD family protein [Bacteroidota bacterium]
MNLLYLKSLHLIFIVTWFTGLFYIVRLFVYHAETSNKPAEEKKVLCAHFVIAEKRLWYGITWPSAIGTYVFGFWMLFELYGWNIPRYLLLKLGFVGGLTLYHLYCGRIFSAFQKNNIIHSGNFLRIWNEVATVFLVAIIFIVVLKGQVSWLSGVAGLLIFSALLISAILIYRRLRK